jgi:NAD(P)-dependent dehydrogenase (short-subunit alcohol dehydrogenase family)
MMMDESNGLKRLEGRVALITGGAQGIGRAIAGLFHKQGACVFILDCDVNAARKAVAELSSENPSLPVWCLAADLGDPAQVASAVKELRKLHDRVDILVNNAGIEIEKTIESLTPADWDHVMNVNLRGAFLLTKELLPLFPQSGGSIVNISSIHATHAFPNSIPYACSKAALVALTRNLALDLASRRIRVNCICPGYIDTRLWDRYIESVPNPAELAKQTADLHPVGRRGIPQDVSEAALFLASDSSSFITGTDIVVDGGLTIRAHP